MSLIPNGLAKSAAEAGFYDHPIEQSLRFNDDDSAYLTRTPSSAGNRKTWTLSWWWKYGVDATTTTNMTFFSAKTNGANIFLYGSGGAAKMNFDHYNGSGYDFQVDWSPVFRDHSAWYHFVIVFDSTNATAADRVKLYVNGVLDTTASYPTSVSSNFDSFFNNTDQHWIGRLGTKYFDGYMAEVHMVDGTALDADSFGETKSGVWIPKAYSGSYGTNGFYLDFDGTYYNDKSGNGNNFTANNLAATDVVLDSPTNNFATLNPLSNGGSTVSEGNNKIVTPSSGYGAITSTFGQSSGKYYWEVCPTSVGTALIGIVDDTFEINGGAVGYLLGSGEKSIAYYYNGNKYIDSSGTSYGSSYTSGDIIGVALNLDDEEITFYKNGVSQGVISSTFVNAMLPAISDGSSASSTFVANFGQDSSFAGNKTAQGNTDDNGYGDFYYAPPSSYLALCSANLSVPDAMNPALDASPQDYFNTVLYTGTGVADRSVTGVGFQPDWTWIKRRNGTNHHRVVDAVRGAANYLASNQTNAESTDSNQVTSFDSDGFTVGTSNSTNGSSNTFVAWNWKANGSGVSNTDGSITSTVSANTDAGFSIVTYTATGSGDITVGHGLNQAPDLIIGKTRNVAYDWRVYHSSLGATKSLTLNYTNAAGTNVAWGNTEPTSTVFTAGRGSTENMNYASGETIVAYCFHSVEGFSKFGSYTGNGSTDGTFVYTGFRPAFVLVKDSSAAQNWRMFDSAREPENTVLAALFPNLSNAESTGETGPDFLSNGFKVRTSSSTHNASGNTIIYMAFAENPFKYANAR